MSHWPIPERQCKNGERNRLRCENHRRSKTTVSRMAAVSAANLPGLSSMNRDDSKYLAYTKVKNCLNAAQSVTAPESHGLAKTHRDCRNKRSSARICPVIANRFLWT